MAPPADKPDASRVAVFLHSGEYDRVHEGLSIAAAAVAADKRADVFLFWFALERLAQGRLDEPDFEREDLVDRFEARRLPTLRSLLAYLRESGQCTLYACTGSMEIIGIQRAALERWVDRFVGWVTIFELTAGVTDRFWL